MRDFPFCMEPYGLDNMVGPIQWAEQGYPPFRRSHRLLHLMQEDDEWNIDDLMEEYSRQFREKNPFIYDNFATKLMFEKAEEQAIANGWGPYKIVENFGLSSVTFTILRLDVQREDSSE